MMNENKLLDQLIKVSQTKTDITRRLRLLREFLENKYYSKKKLTLESFLKTAKCSREDATALSSLSSDFYKSFTKGSTYPLLSKMEKLLNNQDIIHLYTPYEFPPEEKERLGRWFKVNVRKDVILEIAADPKLTLGFAFAYKGVYHNFALKYFLDKNRRQINTILDNYVKNQERNL